MWMLRYIPCRNKVQSCQVPCNLQAVVNKVPKTNKQTNKLLKDFCSLLFNLESWITSQIQSRTTTRARWNTSTLFPGFLIFHFQVSILTLKLEPRLSQLTLLTKLKCLNSHRSFKLFTFSIVCNSKSWLVWSSNCWTELTG